VYESMLGTTRGNAERLYVGLRCGIEQVQAVCVGCLLTPQG
jgi:hypothetical protein